jgi:predicted transcriptional regulator of viral defense system
MNLKLLDKLIHWAKPYLTRTEISLLLDKSPDACDSIIRRAIKAGYLQRVRRGLYLISSKIGVGKVSSREIAQVLYGPSYISFESALSWHGWIPEGVRTLTSATIKKGKEISTPVGTFIYEQTRPVEFSLGVRHIQTNTESFLVADGWKAIADLIYLRKHTWPDIQHISEDLRIELDDFLSSDLNLLKQLANRYPNSRTRYYLNLYYRNLTK